MIEWFEIGLLGLFLASFLAATVLPFSSEAMLAATLLAGFDPLSCLIAASVGNTLGGMSSYLLGYLGDWRRIGKWLRTPEEKVLRWEKLVKRYGAFTALLCWLPFIGDVIAIALGIFRVKAAPTSFWMLVGKTARYALLVYMIAV
jgi:membrane protein YqaA with SNARE-associated domain